MYTQRRPSHRLFRPEGTRNRRTASDRVLWTATESLQTAPWRERRVFPPPLLRAVFTSSSHNSLWPTNLWQSRWPSLTTCIAVSACSPRQRVRASCSQSLGRLTLLEGSTHRAAVASEHALATVAGGSVAKRCGPAAMIFKDRQPAFLSLWQHSPLSQSIGQQTTIAPHCQTSLRLEEPFPRALSESTT